MRKITALIIGSVAAVLFMLVTGATAKSQKELSLEASEQVILRFLYEPATEAIADYYGEHRQYWREELLSVQKLPNSLYYEVIMQVETFYGPHNPPYGLETMTFYVDLPGGIVLHSFEHQDQPD